MPQIWPMNWLMLFLFFIFVFLIFISVFYFNFSVGVKSSHEEGESFVPLKLNWKW